MTVVAVVVDVALLVGVVHVAVPLTVLIADALWVTSVVEVRRVAGHALLIGVVVVVGEVHIAITIQIAKHLSLVDHATLWNFVVRVVVRVLTVGHTLHTVEDLTAVKGAEYTVNGLTYGVVVHAFEALLEALRGDTPCGSGTTASPSCVTGS